MEVVDGAIEGGLLLLVVVLAEEEAVGVIPLAVSRQFVTTL